RHACKDVIARVVERQLQPHARLHAQLVGRRQSINLQVCGLCKLTTQAFEPLQPVGRDCALPLWSVYAPPHDQPSSRYSKRSSERSACPAARVASLTGIVPAKARAAASSERTCSHAHREMAARSASFSRGRGCSSSAWMCLTASR